MEKIIKKLWNVHSSVADPCCNQSHSCGGGR